MPRFRKPARLKAYVNGVTVRRLADAVRADDLLQVQAMLAKRPELADLTISYGDEHRAIHYAVMKRSPEMVRLLMRHGADARRGIHPHREATGPLTLAIERGYDEIVTIIEEEERRRERPSGSPLPAPLGDERAREAVASGDVAWLQSAHAAGTLTNPVRWDGGGLLTAAVRHNRPDILRLLLDFGFDPDERVSSGEGDWVAYSQGYPLWHSAALGSRDMAELLLDGGADPNVHVDSSGSAVYSAYSHKQWEMAEFLRSRGGIVTADIAGLYRQTDLARKLLAEDPVSESVVKDLLHFGASGGTAEIVRMALDRVTWPRDDPRWFSPLTEPLSFWHHIPWLYAGNRDFDREGYLECFRLILDRCDPNLTGGFGRTALHEVAAMGDHVEDDEAAAFARALIEAGARTDVRDDILESTPLGWACRWGRAGVAKELLQAGADPVEADAHAWAQPRGWATKKRHSRVLQVLSEHGG